MNLFDILYSRTLMGCYANCALSADGRTLATTYETAKICADRVFLWDVQSRQQRLAFNGHREELGRLPDYGVDFRRSIDRGDALLSIVGVAFLPASDTLVTLASWFFKQSYAYAPNASDGILDSLLFWDTNTGALRNRVPLSLGFFNASHMLDFIDARLTVDGSLLIVQRRHRYVHHVENPCYFDEFHFPYSGEPPSNVLGDIRDLHSWALAPDGSLLALITNPHGTSPVAGAIEFIRLSKGCREDVSLDTSSCLSRFGAISSARFSWDSRYLLVRSAKFEIWDLVTKEVKFLDNSGYVIAAGFTRDGEEIICEVRDDSGDTVAFETVLLKSLPTSPDPEEEIRLAVECALDAVDPTIRPAVACLFECLKAGAQPTIEMPLRDPGSDVPKAMVPALVAFLQHNHSDDIRANAACMLGVEIGPEAAAATPALIAAAQNDGSSFVREAAIFALRSIGSASLMAYLDHQDPAGRNAMEAALVNLGIVLPENPSADGAPSLKAD